MKIFKWDEINGQDQEVKMEAFLSAVNDTYAILQLKEGEETRPKAQGQECEAFLGR